MSCGIYILRFKDTDKAYIGQSSNIEARFTNHIWSFNTGNASKKLQNAFKEYGTPVMEIILECDTHELDAAEVEAIEIWDSIENGFNTCVGGGAFPVLSGENHPNAKYNKEQIIYIFTNLTSDAPSTHTELSKLTGVDVSTISHVSTGQTHRWLEEIYGEVYLKFINRPKKVRDAKSLRKNYPQIINKEGDIHTVENTHTFAKEHGLDQGNLHKLLTGKSKTCKGWKILV